MRNAVTLAAVLAVLIAAPAAHGSPEATPPPVSTKADPLFTYDARAHRWTRPLPLAETRALIADVRARLATTPTDGVTRVELLERLLDEAAAVAALAPDARAGVKPRALKAAALEVALAAPAEGEDPRVTPRLRFLVGMLAAELGDAAAAGAALAAVLTTAAPEVPLAAARLGDMDLAKGDLWAAVPYYERARAGADGEVARYASWRLAQCRLRLGDAASAKRLLQDVDAQLESATLAPPTAAFRRAVAADLARTVVK